ncbi:dCTP deaminase [Rhodanobacter lindaniclasticus]
MSIKSDKWIRRMAEGRGMIEPFEPGQVKRGTDGGRAVSWGASSSVTTCAARASSRCSPTSTPPSSTRRRSTRTASSTWSRTCASSHRTRSRYAPVELPHPAQRAGGVLGKSTYARCGIIVNVTPLEPEWEGHVTLEFSNTTPLPARTANEGVAQMLFWESDEECEPG